MFEQQSIVAEREADLEAELQPLDSILQPLAAPPVAPQNPGFQLPRGVWAAMLSCYAVFFATIFAATGDSVSARFAIVISVLYTAVYFGVARIGARQAGQEAKSPLEQGKMLDTWTGLMDKTAVYGQILIVPFAVALFGVAILIITVFVGIGE
ncbi:MAG: hypothetical protein CVT75_00170 [Alphaproteobacteria bacterium HGW-Alphaproteobacteria-14]|nr:MAG: hypothetical protein CVT75_00170 [Alphaproteobacteria bacterium HGW-Alphaproteobacteria-14]